MQEKGKGTYLGFENGQLFLCLDEIEHERVGAGEDEGKEEGEAVLRVVRERTC